MTEQTFSTHRVINQSPGFCGHNAFSGDTVLVRLCDRLTESVRRGLESHGRWAGQANTLELARLANRHTPILRTHDSKGNRIDLVEFHPAWHELMRYSIDLGMHCSSWEELPDESGHRHFSRAARYYITAGVEMGHLCPITMTNACVAALMKSPETANQWLPRIVNRSYDPSNRPAHEKGQVILGMGMTEKQGGTDVRANTTRAQPAGDGLWQLIGHKWFMSVPQSDAFLILAQMQEGLGCFLVPRLLDDGSPNGLRFQRLKDKLGNRSNASSEVELCGSLGQLIGPPGKGVQTIIEMVTLTRLDCAVASAGLMWSALWEAVEHCRHRSVMGRVLSQQPVMQRVLADMTIDAVAATVLAFRLAESFDLASGQQSEAAYSRLMTPVIKYWTCKIAAPLITEAMECLGGNGYVEDGNLARHYREAPLNAIWEGSGNVMCLDVLRVLEKHPEALDVLFESLRAGTDHLSPGLGTVIGKQVDSIRRDALDCLNDSGGCRMLTERLALVAAAVELVRWGFDTLAEAFITTRLAGSWRSTYGIIPEKYVEPCLQSIFHIGNDA